MRGTRAIRERDKDVKEGTYHLELSGDEPEVACRFHEACCSLELGEATVAARSAGESTTRSGAPDSPFRRKPSSRYLHTVFGTRRRHKIAYAPDAYIRNTELCQSSPAL